MPQDDYYKIADYALKDIDIDSLFATTQVIDEVEMALLDGTYLDYIKKNENKYQIDYSYNIEKFPVSFHELTFNLIASKQKVETLDKKKYRNILCPDFRKIFK